MINYPEDIRKQSSESVGILDKKVVTEISELPKVVQGDRIIVKSEISRGKSEPSMVHTPDIQGSEDPLVKKTFKSDENEKSDKVEAGGSVFTELKSSSDVEIEERILIREETFGTGSQKIEMVPQRIARIAKESHTSREPVIVREENVKFSENDGLSTSSLLIDRRGVIADGYDRDYSSSESNYSKSSLSTTNNMQLLRKSPFSTRNGSDISRCSSVSQKAGSCELQDFKGSEVLTESDWKELSSKSESYEVIMKVASPLKSVKGGNVATLGEMDTPRLNQACQVSYEGYPGVVKSSCTEVGSSEYYKLIKGDEMKVVNPVSTITSEEGRIVKRFVIDKNELKPMMCYQNINEHPVQIEVERKDNYDLTNTTEEVLRKSVAGNELTRDESATTIADEEDHQDKNNVGIKLKVKEGCKSKKTKGGMRAMEKFNRFFSMLRSGLVKHTMVLAMVFWMLSFWCLYPSIFSGWLKNEIKYQKGDISGSSVTLIGLNSISRHDSAHLKDGALLTLSRIVPFEDILTNEDELLGPYQGITISETGCAKEAPSKKDESEAKDGKSSRVGNTAGEAKTDKKREKVDKSSSSESGGDDEKESTINKDSTSGKDDQATKDKLPGTGQSSSDDKTGEGASSDSEKGKSPGSPKENDKGADGAKEQVTKGKDKKLTDQNKEDDKETEGEKHEEKSLSKRNMRRNDKVIDKVNKSLEIYRRCTHEKKFIKTSCCFRDMCEVGNLDEEDTKYFKSLYGATVYDVHYREFKNLQKGGKVVLSTATLAMFFMAMVVLMPLSRVGAFTHPKLKEAAFNLGIIFWVLGIFLSLLGFLIWNHFTGGSVCVDELGRSKPCSLHYGSILFILHIIFEGIGLILTIVESTLLKPKQTIADGVK